MRWTQRHSSTNDLSNYKKKITKLRIIANGLHIAYFVVTVSLNSILNESVLFKL